MGIARVKPARVKCSKAVVAAISSTAKAALMVCIITTTAIKNNIPDLLAIIKASFVIL